jgi:lysophospholipase L1-like esterase
MIAEAREKGAAPVLLSPTVKSIWKDGRVDRDRGGYGGWAAEVAAAEGVAFIDVNAMIADEYDAMGEERVAALFCNANDHTHTSAEGARVNARLVAAGLKTIRRGVS